MGILLMTYLLFTYFICIVVTDLSTCIKIYLYLSGNDFFYSYRSNAKKASALFQDTLVSPQKELLYWIELVINHGADHLRSPAVRLSIIEKLYLDVIAVVMMFLWFLSKVWKVIKVHWNSETDAVKKNQ